MTAIKTKAVTSAGHVGNLGKYLNDDRALLRDSQHIVNDRRWEKEMDATREAYGHNDPSRAGAKVTYMYHQVIGFNPDECSCNDGKMTPEKCMDFAREWVRNRYPSQEAVWVLHQEHCNADGTDRYAVHIGINRTDLETGKRLCEGRGQKAKVERANAMRQQDGRWGLRQMAKGERNSRVHAMQPTRAEKAMRARGVQPDKAYIRQHVRQHVREISRGDAPGNRMRELSRRLEADGIKMSMSKRLRGWRQPPRAWLLHVGHCQGARNGGGLASRPRGLAGHGPLGQSVQAPGPWRPMAGRPRICSRRIRGLWRFRDRLATG